MNKLQVCTSGISSACQESKEERQDGAFDYRGDAQLLAQGHPHPDGLACEEQYVLRESVLI